MTGPSGTDGGGGGGDGIEIERKWLLTGLPSRIEAFERGDVDPGIDRLRLRQGYLRPATEDEIDALAAAGTEIDSIHFGRLRSIESADGVRHVLTAKSGSGLVRREIERSISTAAFEAAWPATAGRRIEKTRWQVRGADGLVWEVDRFDAIDLVLAEVEVADEASADAIEIPGWLGVAIDREVTHEPLYTNAEIALRAGLGR
jgi:CYTH domain-containing protein